MLEYWFCIIARGPSVSRSQPSFSGTSDGGLAHEVEVVESVGPVNVEFAVFAQSTWNLKTRTRLVQPHTELNRFSRPAGGVPAWSRALLGRSENMLTPLLALATLND